MDVIELRGLRVFGKHGADPGEREHEQAFDVDVSVELDLAAAGASDDLNDTIDYAALRERIARSVQTSSYALLERLATDLATGILTDERIARVRVTIAKPNVFADATPSVTIARENPAFRARLP